MTEISARDQVRRQRVASLLLRGLAPLEIALQLKRQGLTDPATNEAYSQEVISADVAALEAEWQGIFEDREGQRARLLAELREARRAAWAKNDLGEVMQGLRQEADLIKKLPAPRRTHEFSTISASERDLLLPVDG